ncbi:type I secretion system permease/ATPase [Benzoatithermus flavus]|uniref:Type I secretion system permease/ATPase n=1 Tax=Benzoatithermus flavus TaxID=3108223 RepID=A0ABU8XVN9_9PROT
MDTRPMPDRRPPAAVADEADRAVLRPASTTDLLQKAGAAVRRELWSVGAFSLFINLLTLVSSLYSMQLFDRVLSSGSHETLLLLTLVAVAALAVMGLLSGIRRKLLVRIGDWLERELGAPAIDAAVGLKLQGQTRERGAAARALSDIKQFFASEGVVAFLDLPWTPVFLLAIALMHPLLGLFSLAAACLLLACALANEALTRAGSEAAAAAARHTQRLAEEAEGLAEPTAAMGMRTALLRRWRTAQDAAGALAIGVSDRGAAIMSLVQALRSALQLGVMALGAWLVTDRALTSGGMIAASILLARALAPIDRALPAWKAFVAARAGHKMLQDLFRRAPARPPRQRLPRPQGRLVVEGVGYVPPGAELPLLHDISFTLAPGEVLGVIGPSGAGKSTLGHLLVGAWSPRRGTIRLDHAAFEQWNDDELGRHIGYLPQYPSLFRASCAENIARMAAPDQEAVLKAAELAGAHELILRLPKGYETVLGPQGHRLSGGEQQRIALGRAVYGDPALVVLDEPDSHADAAGLQRLQHTIRALQERGAAVVVITHHPAMLRGVDRLLLLCQGRVAAFGPRDEVQARLMAAPRRNVVPMPEARPDPEPQPKRAAAAMPPAGEQP